MGSLKECQYSRIQDMTFRIYTDEEIEKLSVLHVTNSISVNSLGHALEKGIYDLHMGPMDIKDKEKCKTCNNDGMNCPGHFGHIDLPIPICNPFFCEILKDLLARICPFCFRFQVKAIRGIQFVYECMLFNSGYDIQSMNLSHLVRSLLVDRDEAIEVATNIDEEEIYSAKGNDAEVFTLEKNMKKYFKEIRKNCEPFKINTSNSQAVYTDLVKKFLKETVRKKCIYCSECLISPKFQNSRIVLKMSPDLRDRKDGDESKIMPFISDDQPYLTPKQAKKMLRECYKRDGYIIKHLYPFLASSTVQYPTDMFFIQKLLVIPPKFRPPLIFTDKMIESSISELYKSVIKVSRCLHYMIKYKDQDVAELSDDLKYLITEVRGSSVIEKCHNMWHEMQSYVDNILDSKLNRRMRISNKGIRQFIEKKFGLLRQNLMGKRVDYSARSVAAPDAMLAVDEVGVPLDFAVKLTYPVPVTPWNVSRLRKMVENGPMVHPGALFVEDEGGRKTSLKANDLVQRKAIAQSLLTPAESCAKKVNSTKIVYRHLLNGDYVLMNRQPTLHKPSIQAHKVRILPKDRVLRMPYANCKAYNADFDGDELNLHFPQNEVARSEAQEIVTTRNQYLTPKDGSPLAGLIQDCVVGCVMLTLRGNFFNKEDYQQLVFSAVGHMPNKIQLLPPAIHKPKILWSGKQVISTIILNIIPKGKPGPSFKFKTTVKVDLWQKEEPRIWNGGGTPEKNKESMTESQFILSEGELLCGVVDKCAIGSTSFGLIHTFYDLYGGRVSSNLLTAISRLCVTYLQWTGHTISLKEFVTPESTSRKRRKCLKHLIQRTQAEVSKKLGLEEDALAKHIEVLHKSGNQKELGNIDAAYTSVLGPATSSITSENEKNLIRNNLHNKMRMMVDTGAKGSKVNMNQMASLFGSVAIDGKRMPMSITGKTLPSFKPYECDPRAGGYIPNRFVTGMDPKSYFFLCIVGRDSLQHTAVKTANSGYMQRCLIKHLEGIHIAYDKTVRNSDGLVLQFNYGEDGLDVTKVPFLKNIDTVDGLLDNYNRCMDPRSLSIALSTKLPEVEKYKKKMRKLLQERPKERDGPFLKFSREYKTTKSPVKFNRTLGRSTEAVKLLAKWLKLNPEEREAYSAPFSKKKAIKMDPVSSRYDSGSHFGVVSEALDSLIDKYYEERYSVRREAERPLDKDAITTLLHMKAFNSQIDPGEAVGALCAQAIGEPLTQMTLNTFHFAGKDELNITLGVPRMIEILRTASPEIKTPIMSVPFKPHVTKSVAEKLRMMLTPVPLANVLNKVKVTTSLEKGIFLFRQVNLMFHLLPHKEYKKVYYVKPQNIIKYLEKFYFTKVLIANIKAAMQAEAKYGSSTRVRNTEKEKTVDGELEDEDVTKSNNEKENIEEESADEEMDEDEGGNEAGVSGSSRQEKMRERDYSEDEDEEADIENEAKGDEEGEEDEDEDQKGWGNERRKPKMERSHMEDEGIGEELMDDDPSLLQPDEIKKENVSTEELDAKDDNNEKRVHRSFMIAQHNWIVDYDFDDENFLWCKLTINLPLKEGRYDINSIVQSTAQKCLVHKVGGVKKAFVVEEEDRLILRTEGVDLLRMFSFESILDMNKLYTNNIHLMGKIYGVEAAQRSIINEIREVQKAYDINVDFRHLSLLADYFTCEGVYKACSRTSINNCASPVQKMSFETCFSFLRKTILQGLPDTITSPSASVLVGQPIKIGTNSIETLSKFI